MPAAHRGREPGDQRRGPARRRCARGGGSRGRRAAKGSRSRTPARGAVHDQGLARHGGRRHDGGHGRLGDASRTATRRSSPGSRPPAAILLGKTNTPEFTWANEADNLVYGRTSNPYDLDRSSGGSSGGSAAIVAAGGSPFDIGSDTGDSIRQPSHVCGVAGLKPTSGRVPRTGHYPAYRRDPRVVHPARADRAPGRGPRAHPADHRRTGRGGPARRPGRARGSGDVGDPAACGSPGSGTTASRRPRPRRRPPSEAAAERTAALREPGWRADPSGPGGRAAELWDRMIGADGHAWLRRLIAAAGTEGVGSYAGRAPWVSESSGLCRVTSSPHSSRPSTTSGRACCAGWQGST